MITDNKALSAVALLAEEESRNKSNRMIYHITDLRYAEMMKLNESLEPKEMGHGIKVDVRKRGIE